MNARAFSVPPPSKNNSAPTDLDALGEEIAELSAQIQAATFRLLTLIREFDERGGWADQGARSCAHWLNWRVGLGLGAAREKVRVARALGRLPRIGAAMGRGEVSYSKVRAMTRVATPENEEELLCLARAGTAAHVERVVRAWRRVDRIAEAEEAVKQRRERYCRAYPDEDGMLVVRARLPAEVGALLLAALEAAGDELYRRREPGERRGAAVPDPEPSHGQRRADALGLVAEKALEAIGEGPVGRGGAGDRYLVMVHVDAEALERDSETGQATLESGVRVSAETSRRLACDASRVEMRHGRGGQVLDVGRKTRAISPALRRALDFRDSGCRFPGCGVKHCDAHHVRHWADGGKTKLDNLLLLCRRHHTAVHENGYRVELGAGGKARFYGSRGQPIPEAPAPPRLNGDPVARLRRRHAELGLAIDATTGLPTWDGKPLDLAMAVDGLRAVTERPPEIRRTFPRKRPALEVALSAGGENERFDAWSSVRQCREVPP